MHAVESKLMRKVHDALIVVDDHDTQGPRLLDDAQRLLRRIDRLIRMGAIVAGMDLQALELACYALQLPMRHKIGAGASRLGVMNIRERCEQSAELLVMQLGADVTEALLDRTLRILQETSQRSPMLDEAKLLADALNLEDFGVAGLFRAQILLSLGGGGVDQLLQSILKREQYGYWEARLKDGFHFEASRQIAKSRLEATRAAIKLFTDDLDSDGPATTP